MQANCSFSQNLLSLFLGKKDYHYESKKKKSNENHYHLPLCFSHNNFILLKFQTKRKQKIYKTSSTKDAGLHQYTTGMPDISTSYIEAINI